VVDVDTKNSHNFADMTLCSFRCYHSFPLKLPVFKPFAIFPVSKQEIKCARVCVCAHAVLAATWTCKER